MLRTHPLKRSPWSSLAAILALCASFTTAVAQPAVKEGETHRGMLDGRPVKFTVQKGLAITQGDIVLGEAESVLTRMNAQRPDGKSLLGQAREAYAQLAPTVQAKGNVYGSSNRLWPRNAQGIVEVPYVVTTDPDNRAPAAVTAANAQLAGFMQWVPRTTQNDYVSFDLTEDANFGSCFSSIGRIGGMQRIGGSRACGTGTLVHEMGHAVGLWHEQQRSDLNAWLTVDTANVDPAFVGNYDPLSNQRNIGGHDYGSIMHYSPYGFAKVFRPAINTIPSGIPIGARNQYSAADIEAIRRLYGAAEQAITIDSFPSGLRVIVDGTPFDTPAKFNWAIGSTHTLSVPSGVTTLGGVLHTFGRWSSDLAGNLNATQTVTVAAGDGRFGFPADRPAVSTYTAFFSQVVEVQSSSGTAGGSVALDPPPQPIAGAPGAYYRANQLFKAQATAPTGFEFVRFGPTPGSLFHYPAASNRNTNPHQAPVAVGADVPLANWIANFSDQAQVFLRARFEGGEFSGIILERVDTATAGDVSTPETTWTWNAGETRQIKAKDIVRTNTRNIQYKFTGWEGVAPTDATVPDRITVTKPVGGIANSATYTARYAKQFKGYTEIANGIGCGTVALNRAPDADGFYAWGTELTATYSPPAGFQITRWNGNFTPTNGATGTQARFTVNDIPNAAPEINTTGELLRITQVAPEVFDPNTTIEFDITGSGFTSSTEVYVANLRRSSSFVNSSRLRVSIPASESLPPGKSLVSVVNRSGACSATEVSSIDIKGQAAAAADTQPQTGWWWNANESGRGFFIEQRGSQIFMAGYLYEADGRPTWFTAAGSVSNSVFTARATTFRNGQTLEGNYVVPVAGPDLGEVKVTFTSPTSASMQWPGGTTPITTFIFGGSGRGTGENGWWWNATESGRGYSIQVQGNTLFMVAFLYDSAGNPVWYLSSGTMQSASRYTGQLQLVRGGQSLNGPYQPPTTFVDAGNVAIDFTGTDTGTLTTPGGKRVAITRFRF